MIERLKHSSGFGFKATGSISGDDIKTIEPQIERQIAENRKHPIEILIDLTKLKDVEWKPAGKNFGSCQSSAAPSHESP
jgi:hypothetical protein